MLPKPGGHYFEWVKIDLEHWPRGKELPQLPMAFSEMLEGTEGEQTEEGKAKISQLYQEVFLIANTKEPLASYESEQPAVAPDTTGATGTQDNTSSTDDDGQNGNTSGDDNNAGNENGGDDQNGKTDNADKGDAGDGDDASKNDNDDDDDDDASKDGKVDGADGTGFADDLGDATKEAFSSAGQLAVFIPFLGPLLVAVYGQRSKDLGGIETKQHTKVTKSSIDGNGRKTSRVTDTGSYRLGDMTDAKDYIGVLERAVSEIKQKKSSIQDISITLWPQRDGKFGLIDIKTDRHGETRVFTQNNPGKLKWFNIGLAGKRMIKLHERDVSSFNFNGRTITCPFEGSIVEFDVGQLRAISYSTKANGRNEFDIVDFNFDC